MFQKLLNLVTLLLNAAAVVATSKKCTPRYGKTGLKFKRKNILRRHEPPPWPSVKDDSLL